jgi:hypothetical protein
MRKHVERSEHDPWKMTVAYEGTHEHKEPQSHPPEKSRCMQRRQRARQRVSCLLQLCYQHPEAANFKMSFSLLLTLLHIVRVSHCMRVRYELLTAVDAHTQPRSEHMSIDLCDVAVEHRDIHAYVHMHVIVATIRHLRTKMLQESASL